MIPGCWRRALKATFFVLLAIFPAQSVVKAQGSEVPELRKKQFNGNIVGHPCSEANVLSPVRDSLRLLCLREGASANEVTLRSAIVVGFVGGFVNHDDRKRPEVQFAAFLRDKYPTAVRVEVFANRDGKKALHWLLRQLDTNSDGILTTAEKEQAAIIIYGHSWGGSQAVTLARQLDRLDIRVRLTIQVDSVEKLFQSDTHIPANVDRAINFYQSEGLLLRGRPIIIAANLDHTNILGNFRMSYKGHSINCDNYPWLVRVLSKPHHEIENDPAVWNRVGSLIDSELSSQMSASQTSWHSGAARTE